VVFTSREGYSGGCKFEMLHDGILGLLESASSALES
jgi:hypothetical protein